jgi:hypothetical protein
MKRLYSFFKLANDSFLALDRWASGCRDAANGLRGAETVETTVDVKVADATDKLFLGLDTTRFSWIWMSTNEQWVVGIFMINKDK